MTSSSPHRRAYGGWLVGLVAPAAEPSGFLGSIIVATIGAVVLADDGFVMHIGRARLTLVALARNRNATARRVARLRVADLQIDALDRRISQGTRALRLSPSEHVLLYTLAAARGTVVPYRHLADALGTGPEIRANRVARHVTTLRRKLGDPAGRPQYIETIPGTGYRFIAARAS